MISVTLIIFRECLEICLLIGIISSALKDFEQRKKIISFGILLGAFLSVLVAFGFSSISNAFNGEGEEIFNIALLAFSIFCIAYTLKMVKQQVCNLKEKLATSYQKKNFLIISLIIALTILREGAEIILLLGAMSSKLKTIEIISGALAGGFLGIVLGFLLYFGLAKISFKSLFKFINIFLVLLAAGMSAQIANYLLAIDAIQIFGDNMWDSSWLVSQNSFLGKFLHNFIGYSDYPTKLEVIFYFFTASFLSLFVIKDK